MTVISEKKLGNYNWVGITLKTGVNGIIFLLKRMTVIHNIYINPVWGKYISLLLKVLNKKHGVISQFF